MKRKIVQIATYYQKVEEGLSRGILIALADDGTIWRGYQKTANVETWKWYDELPSLPDDNSNLGKVR
jgi:hypothetical protein